MANVVVGSDPEFVLMKDGAPVAAPLAMKSGPEVKEIKTRYGRFFPDNANLEMAPEPSSNKAEFVSNIRELIGIASKAVDGHTLHAIPSMDFPVDQLDHPICKKFACDPDFDAFKLQMNHIDDGAVNKTFRTAGGHVHIGHAQGHDYLQDDWGKINTVKRFELMVGAPSLLLDNDAGSIRRRELYGACSAHRPKEYGVECRSLSNFWTQTPELAGFVFDATQLTAREMQEENLKGFDYDKLPAIINSGNLTKAQELVTEVSNTYPEMSELIEGVKDQANLNKQIPLTETWKL